MKNINILAILLCLFVSCSNHSSIKMNENCGRQPDLVEQTVKFDLINQSMTSTFNIIKYETDSIKAERVTNVNVDEDLLQFFMKYCASKNIVFEDPVMAFVVYTNSIVSESMLVKEEQIKAVSAYTVKRNKIIHHLYLQDNNKNFYEEENVKVSVPWIVSNHITFYIQNYVFPDNRNNSAIIINGELASKVWKNLDRYWTSMKYEVNPRPKTQVRTIITPPGGSSTGCGSDPGCEVGTWNMICMMIITGEYACALADGPLSPCPATELSYYDGPFIDIYDRGLMYAFKDDFLCNSAKGREYIDNYYFLGKEWSGNLTFELAVETAKVLKDFNSIMRAFLNPENHLNDVLFTPQISESLINLVHLYGNITTSKKGKEILETVKQDINSLTNLELEDILKILN